MTITTPEEFHRIGQQEGRALVEGHSTAHMMFDPEGGPGHIAYLRGVISALTAALPTPDDLTLNVTRAIEPKEVTYLVFGTGALSYSWWQRVTWQSVVDEDEDGEPSYGDVEGRADLDIAESTDRLIITSWDGEREGGKKVTTLTFQQVIDAVGKAWHNLPDWAQRDMAEDLGLADSEVADVVLQYAVFGEPVYG